MYKFRKYWLFAWYSCVGTLADLILLIFLSLMFRGIIFSTMLVTFTYDRDLFSILIKNSSAVSNVLSYAVGVAITFILCIKYAFKINDNIPNRIRNTVIIHILGLLVQSGLFAFLIHNGCYEVNAKFITICVNAVLMVIGNLLIVFKKYNQDDDKQQKKVSGT